MFTSENYIAMPKLLDFRFQYKYDLHNRTWNVYEDDCVIASIDADDEDKFQQSSGVTTLDLEILEEFSKFKKRPEYLLVHMYVPVDKSELQDTYEKLFAGAIFARARHQKPQFNPDDAWPQIKKALEWLRTTDFFTAPASSMYHDSFDCGLCFHSIKTACRVVELMHSFKFNDPDKIGDAVFCALVHDWCKIGLYESYLRNVKNEETGVWEKVKAFRYKGDAMINLGHGVSSMFLASKFFKLTIEEASAIRWHMGAYRTSDADFNELQSSCENFMLVHLIQFADQLSLVKY